MIPTMVPPEGINAAWLKILPHIRSLIDEVSGGRVTELSLYRDTVAGKYQLWVVLDEDDADDQGVMKHIAFVLTRVPGYEKTTLVSIEFLGGERLDEWMLPMYDMIEKWAKEVVGAVGVEVVGRVGWERMFRLIGRPFKKKFTIIERRFEDDG